MKHKFIKIFSNPKVVISVASIIALVVGLTSFVIHKNTLNEKFKAVDGIMSVDPISNNNQSKQDLTLAFPVGGRIKSVFVKTGDIVKAGTVLAALDAENAIGAINQAKGAYSAAQTAYTKLLNGASTPDIEVARVALKNAQTAYDNAVSQQKTSVANAFSAMMNSGLTATPTTSGTSVITPIISGTYVGTENGTYTIRTYSTGSGLYYSVQGLDGGADYPVGTTPTPLGVHGLYIQFPGTVSPNLSWTVSVPNMQSPTYLSLSNAYQSALQNQSQVVSATQGAVDTAQAALNLKLANARSEDLDIARAQVESTQGALQIAQGAYNNTLITAPIDGKIINVSITAGQIATPNTPAIELLSQ